MRAGDFYPDLRIEGHYPTLESIPVQKVVRAIIALVIQDSLSIQPRHFMVGSSQRLRPAFFLT